MRNAILSVTEENKTVIKSGIKYKYLVSTTYKLLCQPYVKSIAVKSIAVKMLKRNSLCVKETNETKSKETLD